MKKRYTKLETAEDIEDVRSMRLTIEELELIDIRRDYEALRKAYFKGIAMPPVGHVGIQFVGGEVLAGLMGTGSEHDYLGYCARNLSPHSGLILLRKHAGKVQTRMSLIHEMAHISAEVQFGRRSHGHGKLWQGEMRRLALAGAMENWW